MRIVRVNRKGSETSPPILIGHSFGGLIVQQLLDRGWSSAGIGFDSAAPEGVLAVDWTVLKVNSGSQNGSPGRYVAQLLEPRVTQTGARAIFKGTRSGALCCAQCNPGSSVAICHSM